MNTNTTFDEQERIAFAQGDTRTAALIRDVEYTALDDIEADHEAALEKAHLKGYDLGMSDATPEDAATKIAALGDELYELKRHYKTAYTSLNAVAKHLKGDQCKTIKGRTALAHQVDRTIINLPREA